MISEQKLETRLKSSWLVRAESWLLWLSIFLLSWQLRHTFAFAEIGGVYFEYGSWHLYLIDVVIVLLLGLWLVRRNPTFNTGPKILTWPLLTLLVWLTVSVSWAQDFWLAAFAALHFWLFYGWYLYLINEVKSLSRLVWPLVWGVALQAGWGITQFLANSSLGLNLLGESILDPEKSGIPVVIANEVRQLRAHGLLPHANMLGGWLVATLPVLFYWYTRVKRRGSTKIILAVVALATMAIGLSFARGAWIVLGLVWLGTVLFYWLARQQSKIWLVGLSVLIFGLVLATQFPYVASRFNLDTSWEQRSVTERVESLSYWQSIVKRYPVRGVGIGNYAASLQTVDNSQAGWWYQPVHNIYLLVTGELGVIGAAIGLWLVMAILILKLWLYRRGGVAVLLSAPIIVVLLLGTIDHWLFSLQQGRLLLFFALALIILAFKIPLRETKS